MCILCVRMFITFLNVKFALFAYTSFCVKLTQTENVNLTFFFCVINYNIFIILTCRILFTFYTKFSTEYISGPSAGISADGPEK